MANGFTIPTDKVLNLGKYPNDGTGDDLYTAFNKIKYTFGLINTTFTDGVGGQNIGEGEYVFAGHVDNKLQFKSITGSNGVTVTSTEDTVNISAAAALESDTSPSLGGNLDLNGRNILGTGTPGTSGDIRATVFGRDVNALYIQVQTLLNTPGQDVDLGANWASSEAPYDFGTWE
jgi:hypothetical protein